MDSFFLKVQFLKYFDLNFNIFIFLLSTKSFKELFMKQCFSGSIKNKTIILLPELPFIGGLSLSNVCSNEDDSTSFFNFNVSSEPRDQIGQFIGLWATL